MNKHGFWLVVVPLTLFVGEWVYRWLRQKAD